MHLSGQLSDWSINDLLQIMQVTKKTGSLDIEADRRGRIHFRDGTVTGAELTGANGIYLGSDRGGVADVLYVLSMLDSGSFSVGPADGPDSRGWGVEDVLADVDVLRSLEVEIAEAGLIEGDGVRFVGEISEPISVKPEDWSVLVTLVQPFTFNHLESALGRGEAVRVLHTLHRLGVAEVIRDEGDESGWLDSLAEEISPEPTWLEQVSDDEEPSVPTPVELDVVAAPVELEPAPTPAEPEIDPPLPTVIDIATKDVPGVSAPASTTLTDGVYDEIRRLRSKVAEK
jgi:hypothetical protein